MIRSYAVQSLISALPGALTELLRDTPLSPGKVSFAWRAAVGPALGRETEVRLDKGTLTVEAASAHWVKEVRRSSGIILSRLHTLLGPGPSRPSRYASVRETVIVSAVRAPTGKFLGALKSLTATQLGALVVADAVRRAGIDPALVDECIIGNVVSAGLGQNPARQAAL